MRISWIGVSYEEQGGQAYDAARGDKRNPQAELKS
jgi:hypothetical protein